MLKVPCLTRSGSVRLPQIHKNLGSAVLDVCQSGSKPQNGGYLCRHVQAAKLQVLQVSWSCGVKPMVLTWPVQCCDAQHSQGLLLYSGQPWLLLRNLYPKGMRDTEVYVEQKQEDASAKDMRCLHVWLNLHRSRHTPSGNQKEHSGFT